MVSTEKTKLNADGGSRLFYLDRHNITCNQGEALQGFKLQRKGDTKYQYKYRCLSHPSISKTEVYFDKTAEIETNGNKKKRNPKNSIHFLSYDGIFCKDGYALQQFQFMRKGKTKFYYSFKCVKAEFSSYKSYRTESTDSGNLKTIYLDRQHVKVSAENQVLRGFRLVVEFGLNIHYSVTYGTLKSTK